MVALAALSAMERARRVMRKRMEGEHQPPSQTLVSSLANVAIARFWELLADFCTANSAPKKWKDFIPTDHPFFSFDPNTDKFRLRRL